MTLPEIDILIGELSADMKDDPADALVEVPVGQPSSGLAMSGRLALIA